MKWMLWFLLLCFPLCEAIAQARTVQGVVLDGQTVSLLKDVKVYCGEDTTKTQKTEANGTFQLNVPVNTRTLFLELPGYKPARENIAPQQKFATFFLQPEETEKDNAPAGIASGRGLQVPGGQDFTVSVKSHLDETYEQVTENSFHSPRQYPLSSFILNANEASFCNVRRFINTGMPPPNEAVRIEEIVNYFSYQCPPDTSAASLDFRSDVATCPWNPQHWLMRLSATAKPLPADTVIPNNLVLLIDVSGSMDRANKLPLLKKAFATLVNRLDSSDRIAVVIYAGSVSEILPSTPGYEKHKILDVINNLYAGGSTAGGAGIDTAFKLAKANFLPQGNNRVIIATDGDFNVGRTSDEDMRKLVSQYHSWDISLTCIGVGMGNYKDSKLETLARWGQGNFVYLDNPEEAVRIFSEDKYRQILMPEVRNAVFNVVFNPSLVKNYRLIGYESRRNGEEDSLHYDLPGGEIGYGQSITAFYELEPLDSAGSHSHARSSGESTSGQPLATVALQYDLLKNHHPDLIIKDIGNKIDGFEKAPPDFRFAAAVALFGMVMRQSAYAGDGNLKMATDIVRRAKDGVSKDARKSFLKLLQKAEHMVASR